MIEKKTEIHYKEWAEDKLLPEFWRELVNRARAELSHAYAPYSGFRVAAALRLSDGQILTGTNQENSAFPSGLCAERTLVFYALSAFPDRKIQGLAVVVSRKGKIAPPCGACRQVLADTELKRTGPFPVLFPGEGSAWLEFEKASDLLPFIFEL